MVTRLCCSRLDLKGKRKAPVHFCPLRKWYFVMQSSSHSMFRKSLRTQCREGRVKGNWNSSLEHILLLIEIRRIAGGAAGEQITSNHTLSKIVQKSQVVQQYSCSWLPCSARVKKPQRCGSGSLKSFDFLTKQLRVGSELVPLPVLEAKQISLANLLESLASASLCYLPAITKKILSLAYRICNLLSSNSQSL